MNDISEVIDLPLLPSERRELLQKVKDANARYEQAYDAARRSFTAIINNDESLSLEQKESLIRSIWSRDE